MSQKLVELFFTRILKPNVYQILPKHYLWRVSIFVFIYLIFTSNFILKINFAISERDSQNSNFFWIDKKKGTAHNVTSCCMLEGKVIGVTISIVYLKVLNNNDSEVSDSICFLYPRLRSIDCLKGTGFYHCMHGFFRCDGGLSKFIGTSN